MRFDDDVETSVFCSSDDAAPLLKVVDDVAQMLFGGRDFELHDRFEQCRVSRLQSLLERIGGGDPQRRFVRLFACADGEDRDLEPGEREAADRSAAIGR